MANIILASSDLVIKNSPLLVRNRYLNYNGKPLIRYAPNANFCKSLPLRYAPKAKFICKSINRDTSSSTQNQGKYLLQLILWSMTGVYVLWLFILPFAPGDPAWAIDKATILKLLDLSENFFFILPIANSVGFNIMKSPVVHPTAEALFNVVMGWTLMFGPLLFSDKRNNRFKGPLELLWLGQWLLTNTFTLPYMAIRLNEESPSTEYKVSKFGRAMLSNAKPIGLVGGLVGLISLAWFISGRAELNYGDIVQRWHYFSDYVNSDRVAYAFVWDVCIYSFLQAWLIQSNLDNVKNAGALIRTLSFVPYVGLVAYLWGLADEDFKN